MSDHKFLADTIAGTEIFRRMGADTKAPYVMLHGVGSNASSFLTLVDHLPRDREIITWNAPGYGNSQHLSEKAPVAADYARRLCEVLAALDIGKCILVGHSLGTLMAVEYAVRFQQGVCGLVLLASAQGYGCKPGEQLPAKSLARLDELDRLGPAEFAAKRAPGLFFEPEKNPELVSVALSSMSKVDPAGYAQAVTMLSCGALSKAASGVRTPSLVVVGSQDSITPMDQSQSVHDALSLASPQLPHSLIVVAGAGHAVHQQCPAVVADAMIAFTQALELDSVA